MRKRIFGRRFKRDTNERKALFRSLMNGLILHGKISTTEAKAKAIQGDIEKLITIGKTRGDDARRQLVSKLANETTADKILNVITPLFDKRQGGYTRILRLGNRKKDGARMIWMSWTETVLASDLKAPKRNKVKVEKGKGKSSEKSSATAKESRENLIKKLASKKKSGK